MNRILLWLLLLFVNSFCFAQNFQYISVENGLSNREVYSIQKDTKGYMWFLTHDGIDRFDGKTFTHYKLMIENKEVSSFANLNTLHKDTLGCIWEIGKNGQIFKYSEQFDKFQFVATLSDQINEKDQTFNYAYIDRHNNIWLCANDRQYIYNISSSKFHRIKSKAKLNISNIVQANSNSYYLGTVSGVYPVTLKGDSLHIRHQKNLDTLNIQAKVLHYHPKSKKLIVGSFLKGVYIYNEEDHQISHLKTNLEDVNISCIKPLNETELLIGTDGAGIYKLNLQNHLSKPYIVANYNESNGMNGNNINDIYIDEEQRIWIANYPIGVTILNKRFPKYKWFKHSIGNKNSLINDQVNSIIEDHDGDIWFATNNGISCYNAQKGVWTNMLSSFHSDAQNKNHIFISLCEILPGIIMAGGYTSGMYWIDKRNMTPQYFLPSSLSTSKKMKPDKYIRALYKDSKGNIWAGGYYNLKCIDLKQKTIEAYPGITSINTILEKDQNHLWIGSTNGLYLLDINKKKFTPIQLPIESGYINVIHQEKNGTIYIGTSGSGLVIYNPKNKKVSIYNKSNSSIISNSIYTILPDGKGYLILSTENSLSRFSLKNRKFQNWTKEQGLQTNHFNAASGIITTYGTYIIGSGDGAIEFSKDTSLPSLYKNKMMFNDFHIFYQAIYPGEKNSPLTQSMNETQEINLKHNQNTLSLRLSSINYDYPSDVLYSWKLDGFYDEWNKPSHETLIRYTNLNPGKYKLHVRAVSQEDSHIYEEKSLNIIIHPPFWNTLWAQIIYLLILAGLGTVAARIYSIKKTQKMSNEKIRFFVNTAHDIRTPLTLIKAPLDELLDQETLSSEGQANLLIAIRNTNNLFRMITNLINFEKADVRSEQLKVAEYELYAFLEETIKQFKSYAAYRQVQLTFETNFRFLNVWFDKNKMDSILKNLISNAVKYTPANGSVRIIATTNADTWSIEVQDTGIGIPSNEQKQLFKMFFRGSNAINAKITGSGIGLILVRKLVNSLKGTIHVKSAIDQGSSFKVTFRHGNKHFKKEQIRNADTSAEKAPIADSRLFTRIVNESKQPANIGNTRILVVEDNDELRGYLQKSFSDKYTVFSAEDGQEALDKVKDIAPQLIISDVMMPVMRGDELCIKLKNNIETSHIPIILLTALSDKENILSGLETKADRYMTKPFDIAILKATVDNLLENRLLLTRKFAQLDFHESECNNCATELDFKFMTKVKECIEKNMENPNFNVDTLCSTLNMSRTSFYNKIRALTNQAPADFIRVQRMNRASDLLRTGQYTITEISDIVGFSDAKYFREVFKKHFKMTPSQYIEKESSEE